VSREAWLTAVRDIEPEDFPEAKTSSEIAELLGVGPTCAKKQIKALVKAGKAKAVTRTLTNAVGARMRVPAYLLIP
jgi:DNA-binding Lrp family transcriptional regulator